MQSKQSKSKKLKVTNIFPGPSTAEVGIMVNGCV